MISLARIAALLCGFLLPSDACGQLGNSLFLSREKLVEDLTLLKFEIETYHPGFLDYLDSMQFEKLFTSSLQDQDSMSYAQFFQHISRIPHQVGDGHLEITHANYVYRFIRDELILFPIRIYTYKDQIYIDKNLSTNDVAERGIRILSINGKQTSELLQNFQQFVPRDGKNLSFPKVTVSKYFPLFYAEYEDTPAAFVLQVEDSTGRRGRMSFPAPLLEDQVDFYESRYPKLKGRPGSASILSTNFVDEKIGILKLKSFDLHKYRVQPFLQNFFNKLRRNAISNLVIDLRDNTGGSAGVAFELLSFLSSKEIQPFGNYIISEQTSKEYQTKTLIKSSTILGKYLDAKVKPKKKIFSGNIFVLTNGRTASASVLLAQMLRTHTNAIIVGQEAGANPFVMNAGSFRKIVLPNTRINVSIPLVKNFHQHPRGFSSQWSNS